MSEPAAARPRRSLRDVIVGWTVYPLGDLVAQLISGHVQWQRLVVLAFVGGIIYRFEVPRWFAVLDRFRFEEKTLETNRAARALAKKPRNSEEPEELRGTGGAGDELRGTGRAGAGLNWLGRTLGAILYFNPLWIARHMVFIRLATDAASLAHGPAWLGILRAAAKSFAVNLPISFAGNYLIQMRVPLRWRFLASSIFSAMLATAYALAYRYF